MSKHEQSVTMISEFVVNAMVKVANHCSQETAGTAAINIRCGVDTGHSIADMARGVNLCVGSCTDMALSLAKADIPMKEFTGSTLAECMAECKHYRTTCDLNDIRQKVFISFSGECEFDNQMTQDVIQEALKDIEQEITNNKNGAIASLMDGLTGWLKSGASDSSMSTDLQTYMETTLTTEVLNSVVQAARGSASLDIEAGPMTGLTVSSLEQTTGVKMIASALVRNAIDQTTTQKTEDIVKQKDENETGGALGDLIFMAILAVVVIVVIVVVMKMKGGKAKAAAPPPPPPPQPAARSWWG